jgi:hypothetical protein
LTTGYLGEGVKSLTEILAEEVTRELHLKTVDDTLDTVVGTGQGIIVTGIGDNDIVIRKGRNVGGVIDGLL